jgi:hypothetical protein
VKLVFVDGTEVACTVTRTPALDKQHRKGVIEYWTATPVTPVDPVLTYRVEWEGSLPEMSGLHIEIGQDHDLMGAMDTSLAAEGQ